MDTNRRTRLLAALLIVLAVAAGIRLAALFILRGGPLLHMHHWTESDMHFFRLWAREIVAGDLLSREAGRPAHSWHDNFAREIHAATGSAEPYGPDVRRRLWDRWLGAPRFYQDPLYPYMLAASFAIFGDRAGPVFAAQAAAGLACAALVWLIALRLFDERAALLAGIIAALFGPLLLHEILLLRESAITLTSLAFLSAGIRVLREPRRPGWLLAAGVLAGICVLLKSSALPLLAALVLLILHRDRARLPDGLAAAALCLAGFAAAFSPLVARNLAVGAPALSVASSGPVTFVNHNTADYEAMAGDRISAFAPGILNRTGGRFLPAAVETIRTHGSATGWLALLVGKLLAFWHGWEIPNNASYDYYRLCLGRLSLLLTGFPLIAPLAVVGIAISAFRSHGHALLAAHLAIGMGLAMVFYQLSRFRVPVAMAMIPFAGCALSAGIDALRARRLRSLGAGAAVALLGAALVLRPLPEGAARIRVADYGVANEIAVHLADRREAAGDPEAALALLESQIASAPAPLRALEEQASKDRNRGGPDSAPPTREGVPPSSRPLGSGDANLGSLSAHSALLAGSFRALHERASPIAARLGRSERAWDHARAAEILGRIERAVREAAGPR